jgi:hypothetical protein
MGALVGALILSVVIYEQLGKIINLLEEMKEVKNASSTDGSTDHGRGKK